MKIRWVPEDREWIVVVTRRGRSKRWPNGVELDVASFSTLAQAEEWWLAEGHALYEDAS